MIAELFRLALPIREYSTFDALLTAAKDAHSLDSVARPFALAVNAPGSYLTANALYAEVAGYKEYFKAILEAMRRMAATEDEIAALADMHELYDAIIDKCTAHAALADPNLSRTEKAQLREACQAVGSVWGLSTLGQTTEKTNKMMLMVREIARVLDRNDMVIVADPFLARQVSICTFLKDDEGRTMPAVQPLMQTDLNGTMSPKSDAEVMRALGDMCVSSVSQFITTEFYGRADKFLSVLAHARTHLPSRHADITHVLYKNGMLHMASATFEPKPVDGWPVATRTVCMHHSPYMFDPAWLEPGAWLGFDPSTWVPGEPFEVDFGKVPGFESVLDYQGLAPELKFGLAAGLGRASAPLMHSVYGDDWRYVLLVAGMSSTGKSVLIDAHDKAMYGDVSPYVAHFTTAYQSDFGLPYIASKAVCNLQDLRRDGIPKIGISNWLTLLEGGQLESAVKHGAPIHFKATSHVRGSTNDYDINRLTHASSTGGEAKMRVHAVYFGTAMKDNAVDTKLKRVLWDAHGGRYLACTIVCYRAAKVLVDRLGGGTLQGFLRANFESQRRVEEMCFTEHPIRAFLNSGSVDISAAAASSAVSEQAMRRAYNAFVGEIYGGRVKQTLLFNQTAIAIIKDETAIQVVEPGERYTTPQGARQNTLGERVYVGIAVDASLGNEPLDFHTSLPYQPQQQPPPPPYTQSRGTGARTAAPSSSRPAAAWDNMHIGSTGMLVPPSPNNVPYDEQGRLKVPRPSPSQ